MSNPKYQALAVANSSEESAPETETMAQVVSQIPSTHSSQHLMDGESVLTEEDRKSLRRNSQPEQTFSSVTSSQWFTVAVLCFINLINYMDRFTIAGKFQQVTRLFFHSICARTSASFLLVPYRTIHVLLFTLADYCLRILQRKKCV